MNNKLLTILVLSLALVACGGAENRKAAYLEKAKSSIAIEDYDKARIELKNVLQIDPKDAEAYYLLGTVYEKSKQLQKAFSSYNKSNELNPNLLDNKARLGKLYLFVSQVEKTKEIVEFILSKEPQHTEGLLLKGVLLLREKKSSDAIAIGKSILSRIPADTDTAIFLATIYLSKRDVPSAVNILESSLEKNNKHQELSLLLSTVYVTDKQYEKAEVLYKSALKDAPDNANSYSRLAKLYVLMGNHNEADQVLRDSIRNNPNQISRYLTLVDYIRTTSSNDAAIKQLDIFISENENENLKELRLALGNLLLLDNKKESAIETYKSVIGDFSEEEVGVLARTELATIYIKDEDYSSANEQVTKALSITPNDPKLNLLKARISIYNNEIDNAIISLRIVLKETPEDINGYLLMAHAYKLTENSAQLNDTLNNAYKNTKFNPDSLMKLAKVQIGRDIVAAEKIIDDYNKIRKNDFEGLSLKSAILIKNKKFSEANEYAEKLLEHYPLKPDGYLQSAIYHYSNDAYEPAISILEKGYISVKNNRGILKQLTSLQMRNKQYEIVEKRLSAELNTSPDDAEIKLLLGKVSLVKKDLVTAQNLLADVIQTDPSVEEAYVLLSKIHISKKDLRSTIAVLEKGSAAIPRSTAILSKLASVYQFQDSYEKAIISYRKLNDLKPNNLVIINNLVSLLSTNGDGKEDLELAKKLLLKLKDSNESVFMDTIGWVYYMDSDYTKAISYLTKALEKQPNVNVFNYHLGMAYKSSGNKAQAKSYLEKSLADNKNFKEKELAINALKEL